MRSCSATIEEVVTQMGHEDQDGKQRSAQLIAAFGGMLFGTWISRQKLSESKLSKAELDCPDQAQEIFHEMQDVLEEWRPSHDCITENDFTEDLANYVREETELGVDVYPVTHEGNPDILLDDILALELKISPSKAEVDRAIGQCAAYSREWITWLVVIDPGANEMTRLSQLLIDKGLEQILVWEFS